MLREFAREARILKRLYHDEMDVYRGRIGQDPDSLEYRMGEVCVYRAVPCGLSLSGSDAPERDGVTSAISDTYTIFADASVRLQANDRVVVRTADGVTYEGRSGKTFGCRSHGETPFKVEGVS